MSNESTLVLIKPDGVNRALIGKVIDRLESTGLKIIGKEKLMKFIKYRFHNILLESLFPIYQQQFIKNFVRYFIIRILYNTRKIVVTLAFFLITCQ